MSSKSSLESQKRCDGSVAGGSNLPIPARSHQKQNSGLLKKYHHVFKTRRVERVANVTRGKHEARRAQHVEILPASKFIIFHHLVK
jgi:hypothetical protein